MGDHLQSETGVVPIFILSQIFFRHYHSFSLVSKQDVFLKSYTILDARLQLMWIGRVLALYTGHFTLNAFSALVSFGSDDLKDRVTCTKSKFAVPKGCC